MSLYIIVPVRNEEETIGQTLYNLEKFINVKKKIVVVDDYSTDTTRDIVQDFIARNNSVKFEFVLNDGRQGFSNALKKGINIAEDGAFVVPVMGDLCDQVELIDDMYYKILEGFDIVCASRYIKGGKRKGGPVLKNIISRIISIFFHLIYKIPTTDICNSFKIYRKGVLKNIEITSEGFEISMEIVIKAHFAGYKITELPTIWQEREKGKSKFRLVKDGIKFVKWFVFGLCIPFLRMNSGYISDK